MGITLSKLEEKELTSHLLGIEPTSLAGIIWDTINNVGIDDEIDKFGISFEGEKDSPKVMFWDNGEATEMPKKVFLEILEMMSGRIMEVYERDYNLEKSPELKSGMEKLSLARQQLQKEIGCMQSQECARDYWGRLDSIASIDNEASAEEIIQEVRQRKGSMMWTSGETLLDSRRRMTNRGLEAVVDRLPELRRRYEAAAKKKPIAKVKNKLLALGIFGSKIHPESSLREEDAEEMELPPEGHVRRRRLTLDVSHLPKSPSFHSIRSQSSLNLPDSTSPSCNSSTVNLETPAATPVKGRLRRFATVDIP